MNMDERCESNRLDGVGSTLLPAMNGWATLA